MYKNRGELLEIRKENVFLDDGYIIGGFKTDPMPKNNKKREQTEAHSLT